MPNEVNHEWNTVRLNGTWKMVDVTWGAGFFNNNKKYIQQYNPYYLFADPTELIHTHLPTNARWQLLTSPVTTMHFHQEVHYHAGFFQNDIISCNQPFAYLNAQAKPVSISLITYRPIIYTYRFEDAKKGKVYNSYVSYSYFGLQTCFTIHPPYLALFHFTIYGKIAGSDDQTVALVSYTIVSSKIIDSQQFLSKQCSILWGFTPQYDYLGLRPPEHYASKIITSAANMCNVYFGSILSVSENAYDSYEFKGTIQNLDSCDVEGNDLLTSALNQTSDLQQQNNENTVQLHVKHKTNDMCDSKMVLDMHVKFQSKGNFLLTIFGRSNKNETFTSISRHLLIAL